MTGWDWFGMYVSVGGVMFLVTMVTLTVGDVRDDVGDKWLARMALVSISWPVGFPVVVGYGLYRLLRFLIRTAFPKEGR